jgi:hypothetical protein
VDSGLGLNTMLGLFRHFRHVDVSTVPDATLPVTVVPNYHYVGGTYGDVDFPVEPLDHQIIDTWAGQPLSGANPSSFTVQLTNISGTSHRATTIGQSLANLGFNVGGVTTASTPATTTETIVSYRPGSVSQALTVLRALSGAVMMQADPAVPSGQVNVRVGSTVAVNSPSSSTSQATSTSTSVAAWSKTTTTESTIPTAGGQTPSSAVDQPQPYDPTAC